VGKHRELAEWTFTLGMERGGSLRGGESTEKKGVWTMLPMDPDETAPQGGEERFWKGDEGGVG